LNGFEENIQNYVSLLTFSVIYSRAKENSNQNNTLFSLEVKVGRDWATSQGLALSCYTRPQRFSEAGAFLQIANSCSRRRITFSARPFFGTDQLRRGILNSKAHWKREVENFLKVEQLAQIQAPAFMDLG
jgi:hypothetical protein